jgi:adenine-specific DNA methylase
VVIPKECKRLAEVDFPIAEVSRHSAREKSIRHGHPSTLHLWWARRPLAACRAVLLALLLPDPCDEHCPPEFKTKARESLAKVPGKVGPNDDNLRRALLKFIGDFANWDLASNETYLEASRGLVKAAYGDDPPLVVDPFAGGGSIPLEALRLGCEAFASDLNPVACLILKVMLEDIPRHGPELAEELRRAGEEVKKCAEKELSQFYPPDPDGSWPIAYLWARTVRCEQPDCGAEIPLMRSFWLCKKASRRRALRYSVERPKGKAPFIKFEIFEPKTEMEVLKGTVSRANATCPCCHKVQPASRVRAQLSVQRGGADVVFDEKGNRIGGAMLLGVVTLKSGAAGRHYRLSTERDYAALSRAQERVANLSTGVLPNEPTPAGGGSGAGRAFSVQKYGMMTFANLFTARQKLALATLVQRVSSIKNRAGSEPLALAIDGVVDRNATLATWRPQQDQEKVEHVFARQALPMTWDFGEAVPLSASTGSFEDRVETVAQAIAAVSPYLAVLGQVSIGDARRNPLSDESASVWFTDPPYYDAVPYADLSDFFFVWLKRILVGHPLLRDPLDSANPLSPKMQEIVEDETKVVDNEPKDRLFFEKAMGKAFTEGRRVLREDGVGCVVFAHKTTEGWEALLSGLIKGGWVITGSWPIATEMGTRLRARESAALATSVHLVCRPRTHNRIGDWGQVLRELPSRVGDWMERLQGEGVRGADLVFACIGPALEIFSRYSNVETAEGREVGLPEYLEKVWEVVGRAALEQVLGTAEAKVRNGGAGALEEDARLTALFLWTVQSTNGQTTTAEDTGQEEDEEEEDSEGTSGKKKKGPKLIFDVVRRFAQPLGIRLPDWEGRIIETEKGMVRLLPVRDRTEQLFGEDGAHAVASQLERGAGDAQLNLFPEAEAPLQVRGRKSTRIRTAQPASQAPREATTLDRVHAAMLLQAGGQANALRVLLRTEQQRNPDFLRLANALSALYPKQSEEKRLLDAMLLAVPR